MDDRQLLPIDVELAMPEFSALRSSSSPGRRSGAPTRTRRIGAKLYVRTDDSGSKHEGMTCLIVDMRTSGIEVRPIVTIAGDVHFNEVFFDEARVPVENVLGEVDQGWRVAVATLM